MIQSATARVRPRSLQFDRSSVSSDSRSRHLASRDMSTLSPTPGARTSSLPLSSSRQYIDHTVRHHRSMLEVELTPKLPVAQPLFYPSVSESLRKKGQEELHSGGSIYSQPPRVPNAGSLSIFFRRQIPFFRAWLANICGLCSFERYSYQYPLPYLGGPSAPSHAIFVWIGPFSPGSI